MAMLIKGNQATLMQVLLMVKDTMFINTSFLGTCLIDFLFFD